MFHGKHPKVALDEVAITGFGSNLDPNLAQGFAACLAESKGVKKDCGSEPFPLFINYL
jgi:hypothetical protein